MADFLYGLLSLVQWAFGGVAVEEKRSPRINKKKEK